MPPEALPGPFTRHRQVAYTGTNLVFAIARISLGARDPLRGLVWVGTGAIDIANKTTPQTARSTARTTTYVGPFPPNSGGRTPRIESAESSSETRPFVEDFDIGVPSALEAGVCFQQARQEDPRGCPPNSDAVHILKGGFDDKHAEFLNWQFPHDDRVAPDPPEARWGEALQASRPMPMTAGMIVASSYIALGGTVTLGNSLQDRPFCWQNRHLGGGFGN